MPGAVRLNDLCTGHGCYGGRSNASASGDVFINGRGAHRVGDAWSPHGCAVCPPHGASQASGSPNVYVNGMALARVGDSIDCGSSNSSGSGDVIVNAGFDPIQTFISSNQIEEDLKDGIFDGK